MHAAPSRSRRSRTLPALLAVGLTVLAALLWARLKLVTGLPRSAYAEPAPASDGGAPGGAPRPDRDH